MLKLIVKLAILTLVIKFLVAPYLKENWAEIEHYMPTQVQDLAADFQHHMAENPNGILSTLFADKINNVEEAKKNVSLFEKRMKEMQEAADKAANGG